MRRKLKQADGKVVIGNEFWDREDDIRILTERIDNGAHQLLVAQRRMGKTSLLKEIARRLDDRYTCLFIDLQQAKDPADAIAEISASLIPHKKLWTKTKDLFTNIFKAAKDVVDTVEVCEVKIRLRAGLTAGNWTDRGDSIFDLLAQSEKPVLLMLDEVPVMICRMLRGESRQITPDRRAATDEFMSWLRKSSLRHQGTVRIILSGSIGLEPVLHQAGLSATINNFVPYELKPWDTETSLGCLAALSSQYGIRLGPGAAEAVVGCLGCCIPHHVQMFFRYIHEHCVRRKQKVFSANDVDKVYQIEMLGIHGHVELTTYEERLELILSKDQFPLALEMLTESAVIVCLTPEALEAFQQFYVFQGTPSVQVLREILHVLEHDGYFKRTSKGYVFVSNLLREWWGKRHSAFYVPVLQRGS